VHAHDERRARPAFPERLVQQAISRRLSRKTIRELEEAWYAGHAEAPADLHEVEEETVL
jgi:hypothetical protein